MESTIHRTENSDKIDTKKSDTSADNEEDDYRIQVDEIHLHCYYLSKKLSES